MEVAVTCLEARHQGRMAVSDEADVQASAVLGSLRRKVAAEGYPIHIVRRADILATDLSERRPGGGRGVYVAQRQAVQTLIARVEAGISLSGGAQSSHLPLAIRCLRWRMAANTA